jgi:hypothetical protein
VLSFCRSVVEVDGVVGCLPRLAGSSLFFYGSSARWRGAFFLSFPGCLAGSFWRQNTRSHIFLNLAPTFRRRLNSSESPTFRNEWLAVERNRRIGEMKIGTTGGAMAVMSIMHTITVIIPVGRRLLERCLLITARFSHAAAPLAGGTAGGTSVFNVNQPLCTPPEMRRCRDVSTRKMHEAARRAVQQARIQYCST